MPSSTCIVPPRSEAGLEPWTHRPGARARTWPSEQVIRLICRAIPPVQRADMTALDIGCGNGRNSVALTTLGFGHVIAIDPCPELLTAAANAAAAAGVEVELRHGELPHLPCPLASTELALCWGVLFALGGEAPTRAAVIEIARVLRPGGWLIADWRTEADDLRRFAASTVAPDTYRLGPETPAGLAGVTYSFWTLEQVRLLHAAGGFELAACQRYEIADVFEQNRYSWWQTCARQSPS